jgi:uncharacterized protein (DUF1697 family)
MAPSSSPEPSDQVERNILKKMKLVGTARNLNTVQQLQTLLGKQSA